MNKIMLSFAAITLGFSTVALASGPQVVGVDVSAQSADGKRDFHVAVRHDDTGWDHYADRFEVLDPNGNELGVRILAHPHVNEQPFTRSARGVSIPAGLSHVWVRSRDSNGSYGPQVKVELSGKGQKTSKRFGN